MSTNEQELLEQAELDSLKRQATMLGLKFHPNIGLESLKAKIQAHQAGESEEDEVTPVELGKNLGLRPETEQETKIRLRSAMRALKRVNIQCLDPSKAAWDCDIFTVANDLDTIRRCVPFNKETHVEKAILSMLEEKQYQFFIDVQDNRGNKIKKPIMKKAYVIQYLDDMTKEELDMLAKLQLRAGQ